MTASLTITAARYANADGTAAVMTTAERGDVLASADRADLWSALHAFIAGGGSVEAFADAPPVVSTADKLAMIGLTPEDIRTIVNEGA